MKEKRGQVEVTFHWIYILIAGAVILLFFAGIIVKQKVSFEDKLGEDIVQILDSILAGAGVSEKTKNFVDVGGLSDYTFEFRCEEGYMGFGIKGGAFEDLPISPVFAPKEIKTGKLILWSLPYKFPYKVIDLLMVSSSNTKYVVVGNEFDTFYVELQDMTEGFNFEFVNDLNEVDPGKNFHVRVIDLKGNLGGSGIPATLQELGDEQLSAISFSPGNVVTYFQKDGDDWEQGETVQIISIAEEKDAAKYAAIFAGDGERYMCNMMKVFKRMKYVTEVYAGKLGELKEHYSVFGVPNGAICQSILEEARQSVDIVFERLKGKVSACDDSEDYLSCSDSRMTEPASELRELNDQLESCVKLY
ncbi:hypothetical protein GOV03_03610 [Candidatus Woesearchaeota archaeon]|nr:hypothetical protein [Candidatus Woesearchaeota archaeon]